MRHLIGLIAFSMLFGTAPAGAHTPPTVVLVHGAFAESASWIGEIAGLAGGLVGQLSQVTPATSPTFKRPPSGAMLAAAKDKAKRAGTRLPKGAADDAEICRTFLGPRRAAGDSSSEKQLAYAQKLSGETGMDLPEAARLDAAALSKWIDAARSAGGKDLASPKQREWIAKLVGEGAKPPRGYPDRIGANDARAFLDKTFGKKAARR